MIQLEKGMAVLKKKKMNSHIIVVLSSDEACFLLEVLQHEPTQEAEIKSLIDWQ